MYLCIVFILAAGAAWDIGLIPGLLALIIAVPSAVMALALDGEITAQANADAERREEKKIRERKNARRRELRRLKREAADRKPQ